MDRGAWRATVHGVQRSDMTEVTQRECTLWFLAALVTLNHVSKDDFFQESIFAYLKHLVTKLPWLKIVITLLDLGKVVLE